MHSFQILSTRKISYDICISVHRICSVNVIAYSVKVEDTFVQLSNMRAELRFVYSRHQMDVWDKEQKNIVPRGACNAPFQMPKVLACKCRSCTNHWFPFLKVLHQEAFFCSQAYPYIANNIYALGTSMALQLQSWGWEHCFAVINIAQLNRDHWVTCLETHKNWRTAWSFSVPEPRRFGMKFWYCWMFNIGFICSFARAAGRNTNRTYLLRVCERAELFFFLYNSLLMTLHKQEKRLQGRGAISDPIWQHSPQKWKRSRSLISTTAK